MCLCNAYIVYCILVYRRIQVVSQANKGAKRRKKGKYVILPSCPCKKNTSTVEEKQSLLQQYNLFLCDNIVHFGTKFAFANLFRKYSKTHLTLLSLKHIFILFFSYFSTENEPHLIEFLAILIRVTFLNRVV